LPNLVQDIYDSYIADLNHKKMSSRYAGQEQWFHSSGSGKCIRKHYLDTILQVPLEDRDPIPKTTYRLFRLGDLMHEDIQTAVTLHAQQEGLPIYIEKELFLEDLMVRGFIDLAFVDKDILYDIKTMNSRSWSMTFGTKYGKGISKFNQMQLGTYGLWYQREYKTLKGLSLVFYNKDTSVMREVELSLDVVDDAQEYWEKVKRMTSGDKPPPIAMRSSPVEDWECSYCNLIEACGGGVKPSLLRKKK